MTNYVMAASSNRRLKKSSKLTKLFKAYSNVKMRMKLITNKLELAEPCQNIIAYPQTDRQELVLIMRLLDLKYVQIAKTPWNKKLIGIVRLADIE